MIDWKKYPKATRASICYWIDDMLIANEEFDRPTQKTVADAVEYFPNGWPKHMDDELWFSESENRYMRRIEILPKHKAHFVCDRFQFEAYVKEQECEKWTHVYCGEKCKVIGEPDSFGRVVILTEGDAYFLDKPENLKPIKPTISKAEAWDKVVESKERKDSGLSAISDKVAWVIENYEII